MSPTFQVSVRYLLRMWVELNNTLFYILNTSCFLNSPSSFKEFVSEVGMDPNAPRMIGTTVTGCCHIFLISNFKSANFKSASSPET